MAVSADDLRHVAALARLGLDPARVPALVSELNRILDHMDVLTKVKTESAPAVDGVGTGGMPLRSDDGDQLPLAHPRSEFAPATRDGFFLVPRLASHATAGSAPASTTSDDAEFDEDAA